MSFLRIRRRFAAWLAILAMLVGALAPAITQARVAVSEGNDWLEICSVSGMVWVKAATGETSDQKPGQGAPTSASSQHCPWCTLHGGSVGLLSAPPTLDLAPRLTDLPPAFYRAPETTAVWAPSRSRGPPAAA